MEGAAEAIKPEKSERKRGAERWHHFQLIAPDRAILRGGRSTEDQRFKARSRGRQASAASAVALVCAHLLEPRKWTGGFVDRVLDFGDRLFRMSQTRARLASDEYMTTGLLHDEFFVGDYKCRICVESGLVFGNLRSEAVGAPCLSDGLKAFLTTMDSRNFGVLTSQGTSVAVWSQPAGDGFFYFDPAPSDERGKRSRPGCACLMRFKEPEGILEVFLSNLDRKFDSRYCIDKVSLIKAKPIGRGKCRLQSQDAADLVVDQKLLQSINPMGCVDDPQDCELLDCTKPAPASRAATKSHVVAKKVPLNIEITNYAIRQAKFAAEPLAEQDIADERYAYDDLKVNVPTTFAPLLPAGSDSDVSDAPIILHGWTHEGSDAYKAKGAQSVANCVMAIGMKKVHPVRTWLRKSLDEVLAMGDAIFAQVKAAKPSVKTMTAADLDDARFEIENRKMIVDVDLLTVVGTIISKDPAVVSLKLGLEEFFIKHTDGVLECSSTAVAIWTQDDYFYLFDSKSCDMSGLRVLEQKKGQKKKGKEEAAAGKEKKVIGKCCVIRFPKLGSLCGHFLRNLDSTKSNDRFTIRRVEIVDDVPGIRDWNSFKPAVAGKSWILRGSLNSEDEGFEDHSRGVQGLAMPVVALLSARTIAPANWTREDVDDVVREGDAYYNWCIPPAGDEVDDVEKVLVLKNLKKILHHKKCKAVIELEESCIVGDLQSTRDSDLPNMERGIKHFFENRRFGLVEANNKYFAIWKFEEELRDKSKEAAYYLFHDKPDERFAQLIEPLAGGKADSLMACVLRFLDPRELAFLLTELLQSDEENGKADFFIHDVQVTSVSEPMTDEEIEKDKAVPIKPELNNYSALGETGAFLAGSFSQSNETLFSRKETRDKQQAASALVTLATTKLFDPHLWSGQVLDDILKMADKLTEENAKNIPEIDEEDPAESARDYLLPSEVVEHEFFIGVNEIAVDVEEETAAGKLTELAKALQDFFNSNKMGVFRCEQVMLPIWKEVNAFFTMDPRGKQTGTAAVHWYVDLQSLTEFLLEALEHADGDFAIDSVTLENKYTEAERPPEDFVTDERWYNFAKVSEGHWKIDCNVSLADEMFAEENRGRQSAAVCVIAIVFSKVYEPRHWSAEILDQVTITGDKLHSRSAVRLGENKFFRPNEIISEFFLANRRINLQIHDCVKAGTLGGGKNPKIQNISTGLSRFFEKSVAGCVTIARSTNVAIWIYDDFCYCLEPGASLTRLENVSLLADQLLSYGEMESDFEITSVAVVDWNKLPPWKFDPSPAVRPSNLPPLNAYCKLPGRARAILRGFTHQASDMFSESIRGRQTAANCIVSLAMAVIKNPSTWTRKTLDEILTIGVNVHRESQQYTPKTSSTLRPKDIVRIFHIGVNVLAADVEEETITGIVADPPPVPDEKGKRGSSRKASKRKSSAKDKKKGRTKRVAAPPPPPIFLQEGLRKFFENNNAGILVTGRFMAAIWKDNGVYFMYDPRPRNDQGLRDEDDNEGTSCVVWFACMEPLYELISANINDDEKYARFEISRVIVRTVSIEPLPCPAGYAAAVNESNGSQANDTDCPMPPILAASLLEQPRAAMKVDLETSFERIDKELGVLLASSHMSSRAYPSENRGLQSCAISAVATVVSSLHAPSTWTPELVDACLKYGDILHTECARLVQSGSRNLSPSELLQAFVVGDVRARIRLRKNLVAGISLEHDLASALRLFFASNACGILHTANYTVPVMEHWGLFYVLDPSDRNGFKKDAFDGVACLIKCENVEKLAKIVIRLFAFKEPTVYTLNAVQVLDLHFFTR